MGASRSYRRASLDLTSLAPDKIPQEAPADVWNTGNNVLFRNGESTRTPGDTVTLPGATTGARTCVFTQVGLTSFWVYATNTGIYAHDGTTEFDITPAADWDAVTPGSVATSCVLSGIAYVNISDRVPVYWDGDTGNPCVPLPDWPTGETCIALRAHKNFLFAIGMLPDNPQRVRWSDASEAGAVPQEWTPAADNLAGFVDISPLNSSCFEGAALRDSFLVYKRESVWSFDFVGGNDVFRVRKIFAEHGIAATNALTRGIDDVHLFVGDDGDVYVTDGVRVNSILDGRAQRTFYADFSAATDRVFSCVTLAREKLAYVIYPQAGSSAGNRCIVYDFISQDIGFRDMPDVLCAAEGSRLLDAGDYNTWDGDPDAWDDDAQSWPQLLVGRTLDDVMIGGDFGFAIVSDNASDEFIDGPITARLEKSGLSLGTPETRKMIARVWPKITGRTGDEVTFRIGAQEITSGPVTLSDPVTFTIGQNAPVDTFVQGRFMFLELETVGGAAWRLGSIDVEFRELGGW